MKKKNYITPKEVSEELGFCLATIWRWLRAKKLSAFKVENEYRISRKDLDHFLKVNTSKPLGKYRKKVAKKKK